MGQDTALTPTSARHLLRRTGFGVSKKLLDRWLDRGFNRGQAADELLSFKPTGFKPGGKELFKQHNAWIKYMVKGRSGLNEKLTLFWHDHFSTGFSKVFDTQLMGLQNRYLRKNCKGSMLDLVKGINIDPAMMEFLDTVRNRKKNPNENYGRELLELFTLGVYDLNGNRNYSDQSDPFQVARAFTGWDYDKHQHPVFNEGAHDTTTEFDGSDPVERPDRGPKALFKADLDHPNGFGGYGAGGHNYAPSPADEGLQEIGAVADAIFGHTHKDSDNTVHQTVARRTARRLFEFFVNGGFASAPFGSAERQAIDEAITNSTFATSWNIGALVREILVHDRFYDSLTDPTKKSVKWPVDFVVSTLRTTGVKLITADSIVPGGDGRSIFSHLEDMGQTLLDPPSVFGWDWEAAWISSQTLLSRYGFARDVIMARGPGRLRSDKLVDKTLMDPGDIVDAVTGLLGVEDDFPEFSAQRNALIDYLGGPAATLDLTDDYTRNRKLHGLIGLVIQSPAYQMH